MANKPNNRRVEESVNFLMEALLTLMKRECYHRISITQICQEAHIGRNTFYRNFTTKDDLLKHIIRKKVRDIVEAFEAGRYIDLQNVQTKDMELTYRRYYEFWYSQKQFLSTIHHQNLFCLFANEYAANLHNYVFDYILPPDQSDTAERSADFMYAWSAASLTSLLHTWTVHQFSESIDFMVQLTLRFRSHWGNMTDKTK